MIGAACESAEKVLADTRKAYCFGTRQGPQILPTLDKGQALKIQEQENLLRAAVNSGEGDTLYSPVFLETQACRMSLCLLLLPLRPASFLLSILFVSFPLN